MMTFTHTLTILSLNPTIYTIDFHFWKKTSGQHLHQVGDYGMCPHGSIKFNYAINPDVYNDIDGKTVFSNMNLNRLYSIASYVKTLDNNVLRIFV